MAVLTHPLAETKRRMEKMTNLLKIVILSSQIVTNRSVTNHYENAQEVSYYQPLTTVTNATSMKLHLAFVNDNGTTNGAGWFLETREEP